MLGYRELGAFQQHWPMWLAKPLYNLHFLMAATSDSKEIKVKCAAWYCVSSQVSGALNETKNIWV